MTTKFAYILFKGDRYQSWVADERPDFSDYWRSVKLKRNKGEDWHEYNSRFERGFKEWREEQTKELLIHKLKWIVGEGTEELIAAGRFEDWELRYAAEGTIWK